MTAERFYYQLFMEEFGPVQESDLQQLIKDGTLGDSDLVRSEAVTEWISVASFLKQHPGEEAVLEDISDLSELSFNFEDPEETAAVSRRGRVTDSLPQFSPPETEQVIEEVRLYFCQSFGQTLGPMQLADLQSMVESGAVGDDDLVRQADATWTKASEMPELAEALIHSVITLADSEPSAAVSTRRLFQAPVKTQAPSEPVVEDYEPDYEMSEDVKAAVMTASSIVPPPVASPAPAVARSAGPPIADAVDETADEAPGDSAAGVKKSVPKKKKKQAEKKREEALLENIFDDVFQEPEPVRARPSLSTFSSPGGPSDGMSASGAGTGQSRPGAEPVSTAGAGAGAGRPGFSPIGANTSTPSYGTSNAPTTPSFSRPSTPVVKSVKSSRSSSFTFEGPVRNATIAIAAVLVLGGAMWMFGNPFSGGFNPQKTGKRLAEIVAQYKALGEEPATDAWWALGKSSGAECKNYLQQMLSSGAYGIKSEACMEALKSLITLSTARPENKEKHKELLDRVEKCLSTVNAP